MARGKQHTAEGPGAAPFAPAPEGVEAVDRAVAILRAFEGAGPALSLAKLAAATGFYKSTILRIANSLLHAGLLERVADGRYRLGPTAFRLGTAFRRGLTPGDALLPLMQTLAAEGGESVAFYVPAGTQLRTCLLRVDSSRHAIRYHVHEGELLPYASGSGGRVLAAFLGWPGEPYETIRARFHYVAIGERDTETAGISAPVFGPEGALVGSLTLAGLRSRFTHGVIARMSPRVLEIAAAGTRALGGDDAPLQAARAALGSGRRNPAAPLAL